MYLLVAEDAAAAAWRRAAPDADWVTVGEPAAARAVLTDDSPTVLVLDAVSLPDVVDLFRALRGGAFGDAVVPTVLSLADPPAPDLPTLPVDEVLLAPVARSGRAEALDRAGAVGEYRAAVRRLYERSREVAGGDGGDPYELSESLRDVRALADERLEALVDRPEAVATLLRTAPDGTEG